MPVIAPEVISERGKADAARHRKKQRDAIKKQLPSIIAEESIITGKKGKVVKIPIKNLRIPEFRHSRGKKGAGVGQGKGGKGDVIGRRPGSGEKGKGDKAGQEPGVDYLETEIEIAELIELMLEDLGLPRLEEKNVRQIVIELGWRIHGTAHAGPHVLLDRRKTVREGMKRFWHILEMLHTESGREKLLCYHALKEAKGVAPSALELLVDKKWWPQEGVTKNKDGIPEPKASEHDIAPFPILHPDDMRYHRLEQKTSYKSQAVVFAMMDVSGSMTEEKKYYARSMLFWLTEFLKKIYEHVEIRFIIHHTIAKLTNEEDFFKTGESGGTFCYTAYELANSLIDSDYPLSQWNVYAWHFSDGEDFSPERTVTELKKLFEKGINMFGYGEIQPEEGSSSYPELLEEFTNAFGLEDATEEDGFKVVASEDPNYPLLAVVIEKKEHIFSSLKAFLKRDRWQK